jgi:hypothetical protein
MRESALDAVALLVSLGYSLRTAVFRCSASQVAPATSQSDGCGSTNVPELSRDAIRATWSSRYPQGGDPPRPNATVSTGPRPWGRASRHPSRDHRIWVTGPSVKGRAPSAIPTRPLSPLLAQFRVFSSPNVRGDR